MVLGEVKISDTAGGFGGVLRDDDHFGTGVARLGDVDGDGVSDMAVGAYSSDDGGFNRGSVWVLFMNSDGTVKDEQKISDLEGGFTGVLDDTDEFGFRVAGLGDLDGDGIPDLAAGAIGDDDGGTNRGAVWIMFLRADGTVRQHQKISDAEGGFGVGLGNSDFFGVSIANLGDLDNDGVIDLAVGAHGDNDGGQNRGAVWVLFLNSNGTVRAKQKISSIAGGFAGVLTDDAAFGVGVAGLGDLDNDGNPDLAVGAELGDDGGTNRGEVWVLLLHPNGTVKAHQKISDTEGNFNGALDDNDRFGTGVGAPGDLDADGIPDLAVGAVLDDDGGDSRGAVWVLFLEANGMVRSEQKISTLFGGFGGPLSDGDQFGHGVAGIGDFNGDGLNDLAVGALVSAGNGRGAVWVLSLDGCAAVPPCFQGNADGIGGVNFADITSVLANFGASGTPGVQSPGDANCNGVVNFADVTEVLSSFGSACP